MPIIPNGTRSSAPSTSPTNAPARKRDVKQGGSSTTGGSPRGWTFISTAECWRRWAFLYIFGLRPVKGQEALDLGSAYHALKEGKTLEEVKKLFPEYAFEAARLATVRATKGPPLGPAKSIEETVEIFSGAMTSKPDRVEMDGTVRDYKTAAKIDVEKDQDYWEVDGGILGEAISAGAKSALVDVVAKYSESPAVKIFKITVTDAKVRALHVQVDDFWKQVYVRIERAAVGWKTSKGEKGWGSARTTFNVAFPPNLKACAGHKYRCRYYERCWGTGADALMYRSDEQPAWVWTPKALLAPVKKVYSMFKGLVMRGLDTE